MVVSWYPTDLAEWPTVATVLKAKPTVPKTPSRDPMYPPEGSNPAPSQLQCVPDLLPDP